MKLTIGKGLTSPIGKLEDVADVCARLATTDPNAQGWISLHEYKDNYRRLINWVCAYGVAVDLDFRMQGPDGKAVKADSHLIEDALLAAWESGHILGTYGYPTPHGWRCIYELGEPCTDKEAYMRAVLGANQRVQRTVQQIADRILGPGVLVVVADIAAMQDLARLLWMPICTDEKGLKRYAKVLVQIDDDSGEPSKWVLDHLMQWVVEEKPAAIPPQPTAGPAKPPATYVPKSPEDMASFEDARMRYCQSVKPEQTELHCAYRDVPDKRCPICQESGSFHPLRKGAEEVPGMWVCYNTDHFEDTPGKLRIGVPMMTKGGKIRGAKGDVLDLVCFYLGQTQRETLENAHYLARRVEPAPATPATEGGKPVVMLPHDGANGAPFVSNNQFVDQALETLPPGSLFRYAGTVGEIRSGKAGPVFEPLNGASVALRVGQSAAFQNTKLERQSGGIQHYFDNLSHRHGELLAAAASAHWNIPDLLGMYDYPAVAGDFDVLLPGWNPSSGMWYDQPKHLEQVKPDVEKARNGRAFFLRYMEDFLDVMDLPSVANAVGLIVTAVIRPALAGSPVPLHAALSSMEGSGKSILCEGFVGEAVTGKPSSNIVLGRDKDEASKQLFALARTGVSCIVLDNIAGGSTLSSPLLASTVTQATITSRILGESRTASLPSLFVPMLTGNNVNFSAEITRRVVPILFQPKGRLEDRTFRHNAREWVRENRCELLATVLGAVEVWKQAGRPGHSSGRTTNSFPEWSRAVGGIMDIMGFHEWLEGVRAWQVEDSTNPEVAAMRGFCEAWWNDKLLRGKACRAKDLWPLVSDDPSVFDIYGGNEVQQLKSFGAKLRSMRGRPDLGLFRIHFDGTRMGSAHWRLECLDEKLLRGEREPGEEG